MPDSPPTAVSPAGIDPPTGVDISAFTLAYLQTHELECPACGYNVHRLVEPRCPECGRALALQIVMAEGGYRTAWVVALIAQAIAAGAGLLLAMVVIEAGLPPGNDFREICLKVDVIYLMCNIPLPLGLILLRRWFVSWPAPLQWTISLLVAFFSLGGVIWFNFLLPR